MATESQLSFAAQANLTLAGEDFVGRISRPTGGPMALEAAWINSSGEISLSRLAKALGLPASVGDLKIPLSGVGAAWWPETGRMRLALDLGVFIEFADLPLIKKMAPEGDGLAFGGFGVSREADGGLAFNIKAGLKIGGRELPLDFDLDIPRGRTRDLEPAAPPVSSIKWFELNKSLGPLYFNRLGFSFQEGIITVYVSAGFTLAILTADFYDLYLSIPLPGTEKKKIEFGLKGLSVAVTRDPLYISGGLYLSREEREEGGELVKNLFNGQLAVKFKDFGFTALGSYAELADGSPSFFLYLMINYPLGGDVCFFVTGLAGGFGLNRSLTMPDFDNVASFPLVAAALSPAEAALSPADSPGRALDKLSRWVRPSGGDYFLSVGLAWTSFGMLRCFALLSVEIGHRFRISLLGLASVALPPELPAGQDPIAYARLALKTTIDITDGAIEIIASLTRESYLLDKKCRLTGGAAFCLWAKGPHAGDFLVSLGGCHHPAFNKEAHSHYPALEPVGLNWEVNRELTIKGGAYFALTPNCLMAGGFLEIVYQSGRLRAWFMASADFLIMWKPFYYDLRVSISIGVAYRLKILSVTTELKLELGAAITLCGPPFSGRVTVHLFFISFTIAFGAKPAPPSPLDWKKFAKTFLADKASTKDRSLPAEGLDLIELRLADGLIREVEGRLLVCAKYLRLVARTRMPVTKIEFNGQEAAGYKKTLGLAPMAVEQYQSLLRIYFQDADRPLTENVSPALWASRKPENYRDIDVNAPPIKDALVGLDLRLKGREPTGTLPGQDEFYEMAQLLAPEIILRDGGAWSKEDRPDNRHQVDQKDVFTVLDSRLEENSQRRLILELLAKKFGTTAQASFGELGLRPRDYFRAIPNVCSTGAQVKRDRP